MYLFFEEAGDFKAGTVLKKDGTNYQVELTTGRRCKVKANHVFFEFESPAAATFLTQAQEAATDIDYLQQALIPMTSESHSGEDVAVMASGPWAHLFRGVIEQNVIFHVMLHAVTAE